MASDSGGGGKRKSPPEHNLKEVMALGKDLTDKALDHMDRTNESDASFSDETGEAVWAIASVKTGTCYCGYPAGDGKNGSGEAAAGYHHHAQSR